MKLAPKFDALKRQVEELLPELDLATHTCESCDTEKPANKHDAVAHKALMAFAKKLKGWSDRLRTGNWTEREAEKTAK